MKLKSYITAICIALCPSYSLYGSMSLDEFLERTTYAEMLNELICMTDSIALLEHPKTDPYDKKFIEDSILGKLLRAHTYLNELPRNSMTADEIAYAQSWLELAQRSTKQTCVLRELTRFSQCLNDYFNADTIPAS